MTIRRLLKNTKLEPQEQQVLELVFRRALQRLNLVDRGDPFCEAVARTIIDVHKCGVVDAIEMTELVVREFGGCPRTIKVRLSGL